MLTANDLFLIARYSDSKTNFNSDFYQTIGEVAWEWKDKHGKNTVNITVIINNTSVDVIIQIFNNENEEELERVTKKFETPNNYYDFESFIDNETYNLTVKHRAN